MPLHECACVVEGQPENPTIVSPCIAHLEWMQAERRKETAHLRDCLGSIRAHLVGQDSALAVAIRATCNAGLRENA